MTGLGLVMLSVNGSGGSDVVNGIGIAVVGMLAVFSGLVVLSFLLPLLENWAERRPGKSSAEGQGRDKETPALTPLSPDEIAAVSAAIHAHFCLLDHIESMKLTWETYEKPYTPWRLAGRAELLQEWGSLQYRIRSR
ncbi:MAG: hypothetical protein AVO35_08630 [Candidatus Aegiribacteria sp. MLS_C]|nr:MAG: hypothetical protein AVO35_08630 [Candidatus Aegiribacteria sp. MLS_C]